MLPFRLSLLIYEEREGQRKAPPNNQVDVSQNAQSPIKETLTLGDDEVLGALGCFVDGGEEESGDGNSDVDNHTEESLPDEQNHVSSSIFFSVFIKCWWEAGGHLQIVGLLIPQEVSHRNDCQDQHDHIKDLEIQTHGDPETPSHKDHQRSVEKSRLERGTDAVS